MIISFTKRIEKPWGYEIILSPPKSPVTAKILHINSCCRLSLQYHEVKEETLTLVTGEAKIISGDSKQNLGEKLMKKNVGYFIPKGLIHRLQATTDCDIFESSTPETGTTVRLEDDYSRENETEEERKKNRNLNKLS